MQKGDDADAKAGRTAQTLALNFCWQAEDAEVPAGEDELV